MTTRFHHVANGSATTRLIQAAGIPGTTSIWADPLHDGPVPGGLTDDELLDVRMRFLGGPPDVRFAALGREDPSLDPANDMREWRAAVERHERYDELVLWFEHDLFDQLNLIQLLSWIRGRVPADKPVSLVCIGTFPGRPHFKGLGELTPAELSSLLETRQSVTDVQYQLAADAWQAFREPTPERLEEFRRHDAAALPFLAPAIVRFLQDYPWTVDGLSRTERRLLELANGDGVALRTAFRSMHEGEGAYYIADASLAALAEEMSRASPPLVTLSIEAAEKGVGLRGAIMLTEEGRRVLAGELDRVAACGIDRWLGGVHLHQGGDMWRWNDARQSVAKT